MAEFRDLAEFFDPSLKLPWNGKLYQIAAPSADVGLRCQILANVTTKALAKSRQATADGKKFQPSDLSEHEQEVLGDGDEIVMYRDLLGPTYDELAADGADWPVIKHIAMTAFTHFTLGEEAALEAWEGPKAPEPEPNRAARRAARSTGTAAATSTKRRASTNGTSSRAAKAPAPTPTPARRSRGGTSSATGRS